MTTAMRFLKALVVSVSLSMLGGIFCTEAARSVQPDETTQNRESEDTASCSMTGTQVPELASFDEEMSRLIKEHAIPGATIAVTDQSRLVFARGYGVADEETKEPVLPTSLFRIASVSKPITAIAVLQLVEQQKLTLDTPVFELLGLGSDGTSTRETFDRRWLQITVEHLLEHRGGFDRDTSFDPMFRSMEFAKQLGIDSPPMPRDIIRVMKTRSLDFDPGERYAYSNFGYCLLGRVVEHVSGMAYESYVQQHVLAPIGITDMRIGATRKEGRAEGEVRYYATDRANSVFQSDLGKVTPWPYGGWCIEAMDAHGGWIASAVDLAKLAAALDDPEHCKLLKEASIARMHQRPQSNSAEADKPSSDSAYYSLGWQNRIVSDGKASHWHNGSLDGTTAILIRRHDGKNFVVLLNTRTSKTEKALVNEIDALPHRAAAKVKQWPTTDRFAEFGL